MKAHIAIATLALLGACDNSKPAAKTDQNPAAAASPAGASSDMTAQNTQAVTAKIDWDAARKAKAADSAKAQTAQVAAATQGPPPPVPMLLPSGIVRAANAQAPQVHKTETGYFATYDLPKYSASVTGTNKSYATGGAAGDKTAMKFTQGSGEASLSFSRFGADYLIQFECKQIDGDETCINEAEATEFASKLFVAQTQ
jgi:hypothetical protein